MGEIVVRGHNLMAGYVDAPRATAAAFVDGWFRTGDLGLLDEEGYPTAVDREKDVILRGGYDVHPREVEEALLRHAVVARVAVVGLPDPVYGQEACAVVVPRDGPTPDGALADSVVAWGERHIAAYRRPRRVVFPDRLPLGPGGKVLKGEPAGRLRSSDEAGAARPRGDGPGRFPAGGGGPARTNASEAVRAARSVSPPGAGVRRAQSVSPSVPAAWIASQTSASAPVEDRSRRERAPKRRSR
ncbi:hypothetical protein ABT269_09455 [Streptomyces viridosporus]|uniref:AMP-binding enzyme n=1 Tax=Streptomyces viridosporus TaxID=67581 RepID=UPI00332DE3E7